MALWHAVPEGRRGRPSVTYVLDARFQCGHNVIDLETRSKPVGDDFA